LQNDSGIFQATAAAIAFSLAAAAFASRALLKGFAGFRSTFSKGVQGSTLAPPPAPPPHQRIASQVSSPK
jgi:hypothetical protein